MTRVTPRFIPQIQLRRPVKAAKSALYWSWMVDQFRGAGFVRPGLVSGVRFTDLEDKGSAPQDFDGMPGLPSKVKGAALTLSNKIEWIPKHAHDWNHNPSTQESAWRELDRNVFEARIEEINAALVNAKDDEKKKLEEEKTDAQSILSQLNRGGEGYLRTAWGAMETQTTGIFWGLAAPNVPVSLTSTFTLERDRAFSFAFKRQAAPVEQAQFRFIIGFGNGFTQYALSIGDDGNSTEFWHCRNMSAAARAKLLAQYEVLLNFGRLTVADRAQLLDWETQERAIRAKAKKRERGEKKLMDEESKAIETLQKQASDLKESKRLTEGQSQKKQDLENQIFLAQETFKLQEESADLIGKRVDVTIQFLQAGYVVVRSGQTQYVYENKRITGLEPPGFHSGLPEKSRLSIQSDGGKWGFVLGRPKWNESGVVLSQPFASIEALDPTDFGPRIVGAFIDGPGCNATAQLVELKAPTGSQPGQYQAKVTLQSDGRFSPELYCIGLYRPASLVESEGVRKLE